MTLWLLIWAGSVAMLLTHFKGLRRSYAAAATFTMLASLGALAWEALH